MITHPPAFAIGDTVRSKVDRTRGYIITAKVVRLEATDWLCADSDGCEIVRQQMELEREDPLTEAE